MNEKLQVKKISNNATIPSRGSKHSVGYDLYSAKDIMIPSNSHKLIPTDIAICMPKGVYGRIAPRSGLSYKYSTNVGAGVIDSDYRGNIKVLLFNHGISNLKIKKGERIAQLILEKCKIVSVEEVKELNYTQRGEKGFGSTGK